MQHYRQLQCAWRQRAPGSPTLAHSALRQHPLFTKPLSIIVFVGNVYFFHSNLSFPQSRSSRQPARWSQHRQAEKEKMKSSTCLPWYKTQQNPAKNRPGPSPPRSGCKEIRFFFFFFFPALVILLFLLSTTASHLLLRTQAGCVDARRQESCFNLLSEYLSTCISLFSPDGKRLFIEEWHFSFLGKDNTNKDPLCDTVQFSLVLSAFCPCGVFFVVFCFFPLARGDFCFWAWRVFLFYKSSYLLSCLKYTTKCVLEYIMKCGNPAYTWQNVTKG